jgi:hypothetical protein
MLTYQDYKTKIDMLAFLAQHGFQLDKDKSTRSCKVVKSVSSETLLVRQNEGDGHFYYTDPNNARNKGDIIDLVCHLHSLDKKSGFFQINDILSQFIGVSNEMGHLSKNLSVEKEELKLENLTDLKDVSYLHFRGISNDTIKSPLFVDRIFNYQITSAAKGKEYVNTAFPLYNELGDITALNLRNKAFKEFLKNSLKSQGVWHSNFPTSSCISAVLGEAELDMLSHYQMHGKKRDDLFYVAFCGEYGKQQLNCCQSLLDKVKPEFIVLANDNELKGCLFNLQLSGFLLESTFVFQVAWDKKEKLLVVHFQLKNNQLLNKLEIKYITESVNEYQHELVKSVVHDKEVVLSFKEDLGLWKLLNKAFLKWRGFENKIRIHYPVKKDFNDDLNKK